MNFKKEIEIGKKKIGGKRTFIIAEIGSNHNQDINLAYELIDVAAKHGADAVKFQSIKPEKIYSLEDLSQPDMDILNNIELKEDWYNKLNSYCKKREILFFSSPTYLEAIDLLVKCDVKLMKIASPQTFGFPQVIKKVGETGLPTIMSLGYCTINEMERAVNLFKNTGNDKLVLMYCIPNYPTNPSRVYLEFIKTLEVKFSVITGFSDHTLGYHIAVAAVAKGAKVIEKHITLSRIMNGPDHHFALEPDEFKEMVKNIRDIEKNTGKFYEDNLRQFEINAREDIEMKICAIQDLKKDEVISYDKIAYLRSKKSLGISSWEEEKVINKRTKRKINKFEFLEFENIY